MRYILTKILATKNVIAEYQEAGFEIIEDPYHKRVLAIYWRLAESVPILITST